MRAVLIHLCMNIYYILGDAVVGGVRTIRVANLLLVSPIFQRLTFVGCANRMLADERKPGRRFNVIVRTTVLHGMRGGVRLKYHASRATLKNMSYVRICGF